MAGRTDPKNGGVLGSAILNSPSRPELYLRDGRVRKRQIVHPWGLRSETYKSADGCVNDS